MEEDQEADEEDVSEEEAASKAGAERDSARTALRQRAVAPDKS